MSSVTWSPSMSPTVAAGLREATPYAVTGFVGKGHDTFAPQGPWIVPREFYGDPMKNLRQTLSVDGTQLQEARAGDMIHSLWELIEYGSSIITLYPGDVINNGTSGGTAAGAAATRGPEGSFPQAGRGGRGVRSTASARCGSRSSPATSRRATWGLGCRRSSRIADWRPARRLRSAYRSCRWRRFHRRPCRPGIVSPPVSLRWIGALQLRALDLGELHQVALKAALQCAPMDRDRDTCRNAGLDEDVMAASDPLQMPSSRFEQRAELLAR